MSSKQTRRSVSISGVLHKALRNYCNVHGRTASDLVETEMRQFLKLPRRELPAPVKRPPEKQARAPQPKKAAPAKPGPAPKAKANSNGSKNGNGSAKPMKTTTEVFPEKLGESAAVKLVPEVAKSESSSNFDANGRPRGIPAPSAPRAPGNILNF